MNIDIPGFGVLDLQHLVFDFNGTIARDGKLLSNVDKTLKDLASQFTIHVLTADTCGTVEKQLDGLPCTIHIISCGMEAEQKQHYVNSLGAEHVLCIGNGTNDRLMLKASRLGIAVFEGEGTAVSAVLEADIIARSIYDALGLLMIPHRIVATMRS
jgi:P-type E1-E2 ATPase